MDLIYVHGTIHRIVNLASKLSQKPIKILLFAIVFFHFWSKMIKTDYMPNYR